MKTIKDVAKLAGVSPATVSRVLNNSASVRSSTRHKIEQAIKALDFRPNESARALVRQNVKTIGVVISELSEPFFAQMAASIEATAKKHNYRVLISTGSLDANKEKSAIESLIAQQCTALVVNSKVLPDHDLIQFANNNPGFVLINKYVEQIKHRCVWFDNELGGELLAKQALTKGHKSIAVVMARQKAHDSSRRLKGVRRAFDSFGQRLSLKDIYHASPDFKGGQHALTRILKSDKQYTAVLCYNDMVASGVLAQLSSLKYSVPNDMSVIGFDDVLIANYCSPKLTTIKYPIDVMAQKATDLSLSLISANESQLNANGYCYKPYAVQRQSVARV
ncbi:LacI family DNA-binding transcriptional regulator [Echinimonas agarilytica]|uniref:LacI family transcriptional regulator n=1 Tax=Echinimonas agarilytica TaxID=1215918 RepID=A0AA42B9I6_9GAMM|nr:LacI family DNA-binding transcriptional regulator [Echinimonas agarilytica]MCM2681131.1 LacI family transcriptional regulator [Echinimonas agarilytica]